MFSLLAQVLYWLKMRFQIDCPEGYNPQVRPMLLTLDKITYMHRPLVFYASLTIIQVLGHSVLTLLGFRRHEVNGIAYWYRSRVRDVRPGEEASLPMVFFHGISPGLNLYLLVIHTLSRGRKMVLMEVPHIAMCLNFKAKRLGDMVKTVEIIAKRHRMPYFSVVGHSFGSLCAAWVSKHLKHNVRQLVLLDPVSLLLGLPDVCYNFLHKKPKTVMEHLLHYGGSMEITIHHTLRRQFWWYEGQLFLDEIKCPVYVGLSGNDEIVPSAILKLYIEDHLAKTHAEEHHRHLVRARRSSSRGVGNGSSHSQPHNQDSTCKTFDKETASVSSDKEQVAGPELVSGSGGLSTAPCRLNHTPGDERGCILQRIQYVYWEGWSHGEILFRFPQLKALDVALREQEKLFRSPDVSAAIDMSRKGGAHRQSSLDHSRAVMSSHRDTRNLSTSAVVGVNENVGAGLGSSVKFKS